MIPMIDISTKYDLRATTRSNYDYMYNRFVRHTFGKKKIAGTKYSDVLQFTATCLKGKVIVRDAGLSSYPASSDIPIGGSR